MRTATRRHVERQIKNAYSRSLRKLKRHPYQTATGALLGLGALSAGVYYIFLRHTK